MHSEQGGSSCSHTPSMQRQRNRSQRAAWDFPISSGPHSPELVGKALLSSGCADMVSIPSAEDTTSFILTLFESELSWPEPNALLNPGLLLLQISIAAW